MLYFFLTTAALIIAVLGWYAGKLLSQLQQQNKRQQRARQARVENISQSIQTIAFAMMQQQCNLSEGAIRICRLLESLPIQPLPNYPEMYPQIHLLFEHVKHLPTHEERARLTKSERRKQDKAREQKESELESSILQELQKLRVFSCA